MIPDGTWPPLIEAWLRSVLIEQAHPLLLSFDADWQLHDARGDAAFHGIDLGESGRGLQQLQDLFIGLPLDGNQEIPFVELANGRSVHVHLIADGDSFHVLLIDAEEARTRERAQQQLGHEAMLAGHEKTRAIGQLKDIRSQLERQRASLEEANALKNALIATLSHEFRTPLTSIFGYLHLLERDAEATATPALRAIRRSATYLFTLAENLLEYGRDESSVTLLNPSRVDLVALRDDLDAMFRPLAEDKHLAFRATLVSDEPAVPVFDEVRLRQVAINLLSNAVRYTAQGEIEATIVWRSGRLRIEVRDSGIGIAPEFQGSVFTPFNRGGQSGSKGAGLGLSIVRRLVTQMHGTMRLESAPGQGSTFHLDLPPLPLADAARAPISLRGRTALVVDDDPDVAGLLDALLGDLGFQVRVLGNAQAAITQAQRAPPDVLLIDVELPDQSGNAAVYQLRAQGYRGRIVTLSAAATAEARDASLRAGADHYMTKPLNLEQFVDVMSRAASVDVR